MTLPEALRARAEELWGSQTFDAGLYVGFKDDDGGQVVAAAQDMDAQGVVFLVDHLWCFDTITTALQSLREVEIEKLGGRIADIVAVPHADITIDEQWRRDLLQRTLPLVKEYQATPTSNVCFLMDEVGSRLTHTSQEDANFGIETIVDAESGMAYCACWPLKSVSTGVVLSAAWQQPRVTERLQEELTALPVWEGHCESQVVTLWEATQEKGAVERVGVCPLGAAPPGGHTSLIVGAEKRVAKHLIQAADEQQLPCAAITYHTGITERDFSIGARSNREAARECADALAAKYDFILQFAVGDAVEDYVCGERVARCHDILAVLKEIKLNHPQCLVLPSWDVLEFTYMAHMRGEGVPIIPTVIVTLKDYETLGVDGIAALVQEQQRNRWGSALAMTQSTLFCKEDGGWAREGNRTIKLSQFDCATEIAAGLAPILQDLFANPARPNATGVQIQPCLVALSGDCAEYRGFWIEGKLITILSTYFGTDAEGLQYSKCPVADSSMKEERGRLYACDLGLPGDDELLNGVMQQVRDSSVSSCGEMPPMLRTDVAVDEESGEVVLIEIETGFDSALFPEVLEFDIEGAVCDYYTRCITQAIAQKEGH